MLYKGLQKNWGQMTGNHCRDGQMTKDLRMKDDAKTKNSPGKGTLGESLKNHGVSRRSFMKFCATTASMMALPPSRPA